MADAPSLGVRVYANVDELKKALRDGTAEIATTTGAMEKLSTSLRGDKLIQNANNITASVLNIGGASKLTEAEQARVNATLDKAIQKYELMGKVAPQAMRDLYDATKQIPAPAEAANASLDKIWTGLKGAAGLIGVTFTAGAIVNFASTIFDTASRINDMSIALGWSAEALQRAKFAAEQSGGSFDALERAAQKLNVALADGDKSTVAALGKAGLSIDTLRTMKPEAAFLAVADAVGKIPDPMARAQVAQDLFGKGALQLLPGMIEGYQKLGEGATVMSNETTARLTNAQDAWERFKTAIVIYSGEVLGELMRVWGEVVPALWGAVAGGLSTLAGKFLTFGSDVVTYVQATYRDIKTWLYDSFMERVYKPIDTAVGKMSGFFSTAGLAIVKAVQDTYSGVKLWLVDKFQAIVDSVKGKVAAVTGFFGDLYDKVVGNSYVPDLIEGIKTHFGKLGEVMELPTKTSTESVSGLFGTMFSAITGQHTVFGSTVGGLIAQHIGGPVGLAFGAMATSVLGQVDGMLGQAGQKISSWLQTHAPLISSVLGPIFSGGSGATVGGRILESTFGFDPIKLIMGGERRSPEAWTGISQEEYDRRYGSVLENEREYDRVHGNLTPMAAGGVVTRPTPILAGEAGPEAIVPLSRAMGNDDMLRELRALRGELTATFSTLPHMLATQLAGQLAMVRR